MSESDTTNRLDPIRLLGAAHEQLLVDEARTYRRPLDIVFVGVSIVALVVTSFVVTAAAVFLAGSIIGSASPTPGGLGVLEGALVAGFTAFGVAANLAVAGVLLYRLLTFWLPILPAAVAFWYLQNEGTI